MNSKVTKLLVLSCILGLLFSAPLRAQVSGATLSGVVTDAQGGVVPNAKVSVKNLGTGIAVETTTNGAGVYNVPNLTPADYEVSVSAQGFRTAVSKVTLTVGAKQEMNFSLTVGQITQTVEVTGAALQVDLASSTISGSVVGSAVRELPLNGRDWTALATMEPGVTSVRTQIAPVGPAPQGVRGLGMQLTISGNRATQNSYRLDGGLVNDYSNAGPGSVLGQNLGVDAIQEFTVLTSNYSAEYGFTSGGVINAVTRSGTNSFHGTAFEFLRNDKLDAANFFDNANGRPKSTFRQNQFGGSGGGPIIKNKVFIFGNYEGIRYVKGLPTSNKTLSTAVRNGIVTNLANGDVYNIPAGTITATNPADNATFTPTPIDPIIQKFLAFYPLPSPGIPLSNANVGLFNFESVNRARENFYTFKGDYKISSKDSLFATFVHDKSNLLFPQAFNNFLTQNFSYREAIILEETYIFSPAFVNSVRVAVSRTRSDQGHTDTALNPVAGDASLEQVPGLTPDVVGPPSIALAGTGVNTTGGGVHGPTAQDYGLQFGQIYDDAFSTHGNHRLKYGGSFFRMWNFATNNRGANGAGQFNGNLAFVPGGPPTPTNPKPCTGTVYGTPPVNQCSVGGPSGAILDLLTNQPQRATSTRYLLPANAPYPLINKRYPRTNVVGAYFQDDWRFRPNLTLNLGVRYEMMSNPKEKYGREAFLRTIYSLPTDVIDQFRSRNVTTKNFEPRIGFAWDPFHNGKTAVRGGFGLFDVLPLFYETAVEQFNAPLFPFLPVVGDPFNSHINQGTWPYSIPGLVLNQGKPTGSQFGFIDVPKRNYVYQYNLNIQRQITPSTTVTVAYVGSHGVHQPDAEDAINGVLGTKTPVGYVWPVPWTYCAGLDKPKGSGCTVAANPQGLKATPNPNVGPIQSVFWQGMSYYNALLLSLNKKMSRGFQFQSSFTWSKSIDTSSTSITGDSYTNSNATKTWYDIGAGRAPSDFDIKRVLAVSAFWNPPTPKSLGAFGSRALGGWQLGTIASVSDGVPIWPMVGTDGNDMLGEQVASENPPDVIPGACSSFIQSRNPNQYLNLKCFGLVQQDKVGQGNMSINPATGVPYCDAGRANALALAAGSAGVPGLKTSCPNIRGNLGRNTIAGPGLVNIDFSVFKNNYISRLSESANLQFRAEFFNLFNRANFAPPDQQGPPVGLEIINSSGTVPAGAGQILNTQTPGRVIQFALKLIW